MLQGVIDKSPASQIPRLPWGTALFAVLCLLLILGVAAAWAHARTAIPNLGNPHHLQHSGLEAAWAKGSVIVVLRHAERCDRSSGACLGAPSGITVAGSHVAAEVGNGLQHLGLGSADVWASPEVRTRQTAHAMFDKTVPTRGWLNQCDGHFAENALALKRNGHNLVLVSHSGCMERLEQALEVPASATSNSYASALFITQGSDGKAKLLGQIAASEWPSLVDAKEL
ncbi:TPA: histidine phosphatase family protein [Pseudomonas putida]|jgi:phosphohistidine phosphatase SixA|uniref:lipopolysaccharide core heptose(II)-phosphate phosphatase PmrG n=1 Tax=Pseudomonas TaxID=286 RepID=UPI00235D4075|nr:histidine phosphatase family protein [Pseudomonas putida]ELF6208097.1 histidine phosphatase family protein [Pseudomonas putida]GLO07456.1 histidine phosphatase family protein [Pseudomonas putida]GLO27572.1 histidine phosphatase family protein [Pseudomonas putida]HDS0972305.1 histidine phosphatase family protein [Pseudomonas putida]HDS0987702.1 histidine phosphatase family protein [Pseudomonas putida]